MPLICTKNSFIRAAARGDMKDIQAHFNSRRYKDEWLIAKDYYGCTALYYAAAYGHSSIAEALIAKGANVNLDSSGFYMAVLRGHNNTVKVLLDAKANPNGTYYNKSLLTLSIQNNRPKILQMLIAAGADIQAHDGQALNTAAEKGRLNFVKILVEAGADINKADNDGGTPLHLAIYNDHADVIEYLLEQGAKTDIPNRHDKTALAVAEKMSFIPEALKRRMMMASETWVMMGADKIAHVGVYPDMQRKLTDIFNFSSRERIMISENLVTKAETLSPPESFNTLSEDTLRKAFDNFKQQGGKADESFVFKHCMLAKPARQIKPAE